MESGLARRNYAQYFIFQTLQVLLVGACNKIGDALVVLNCVESLAPIYKRSLLGRLQRYRQEKVVTGEVLDLEYLARY